MTDISEEFAMSKFASSADRSAALLNEIESLRLDAVRYRWLREHGAWETEAFLNGLTPAEYDAATDAAMKA